ncbi:MAG: NAD(P)/FAD-dependent oxidoreductase [Chthoniobacterales bacterium]|nr:NAD(P)/FAD-dependent oxidoreductase [Chthoniobacterales bacterium]
MEHRDVIILGGGAAGLFCALTAGQRGRRVLVLEHNARVGKKIEISGGGRCNFTNIRATPENYLSESPDFCRSALARFAPNDFLALVESHGIRWHEKKLGQLFCDGSSREIVAMLLEECSRAGAEVRCGVHINEIAKPEKFRICTSSGDFSCDALVVATGGLSFAKLGATGLGHDIARQFGLRLTKIRPGLVPLALDHKDLSVFGPLSGVSIPVRAMHHGAVFEESLLLTHRGFSGPAVLQISNYWHPGEAVEFDLLPHGNDTPAPGREPAVAQLARFWPKRFAEAWCARHAPAKPVAQWTAREREQTSRLIHHWPVTFPASEGYPKAEVTLGGVDTRELSSKTMECRSVSGLYFIGEVVDVTGWLGGYNFQWAWASAHAAGEAI